MKKNISHKEGILKWLKMSEKDFYAHPAYQDQNHPETHKMLAAYEQFRSGGNLPIAQNSLQLSGDPNLLKTIQQYRPNYAYPTQSIDPGFYIDPSKFGVTSMPNNDPGFSIGNQDSLQANKQFNEILNTRPNGMNTMINYKPAYAPDLYNQILNRVQNKKALGGFIDPTKPYKPSNIVNGVEMGNPDGYFGQTGYKVPVTNNPNNPFGSVNTMPFTNGVSLLEQAKKWNSNEKNIRMNPSMIEYTQEMRAKDSLMNKLFPRKMALGGNIYGDVGDSTQGDQGQYLTQYQQEMQQLQNADQNNTNTLNQYNQGVQENIQQQEDNYVDPMTAIGKTSSNAEMGIKVANTAIDIFGQRTVEELGKKTAEELANRSARLALRVGTQQGTKAATKTAAKLATNQLARTAGTTGAGTTGAGTAASVGTGLASAATIGLPILGEITNQSIRALTPDRQVDGQKFERTGAIIGGDTAKWAGIGAGVGTAITPGLGTAIGAGVGAVGGFVGGLIQSSGNNKKYKQALERSTMNRHRESMDSYDPINIGKQGLPGYQMGGRLSEYEMGGNLGNTKSIINSYFDPMFGLPEYAVGGNISKAQSNDLVSIGGEYHENGGTPVNSLGQAVDEEYAVAEAEKGEVSRNGYIYSDTLGVDKNGNPTGNKREVKTTYAKLAKSINKKYNRKEDTLGMRTKEFEYDNLKENSEYSRKLKELYDQQKAVQAFDRYQKKYGGLIKAQFSLQLHPNYRPNIPPLDIYGNIPGQGRIQWPIQGLSGFQTGNGINMQYLFPGSPFGPTRNLASPPDVGDPYVPQTGVPQLLPNGFIPNWTPVTPSTGSATRQYGETDETLHRGANNNTPLKPNLISNPPDVSINPNTNNYNPNTSWFTQRRIQQPVPTQFPTNPTAKYNPNYFPSNLNLNPNITRYFKESPLGKTELNPLGYPGLMTDPPGYVPGTNTYKAPPPKEKKEKPDYYGLGLATIPHLIDAAIASKKDDNRYYPNEKAGLARRDISNLSTDINIDAALAQNTRDSRAAMKAAENRNPSIANSINSQMLTNKLYANNKLYEGKYNTEKALEKEKGFALSNLDYTSGEADRRERIAEEDKNIANRSRRQDILRKNIEDTAKDLNTLRNEKIGYGGINDALKYGKYNSTTGKWTAKKGVNPYHFDLFIDNLTTAERKELEKKSKKEKEEKK